MAGKQTNKINNGIRENQVIVTARRALGINKMYILIAIIIGFGVLFFLNPTYINLSNNSNISNSTNITGIVGTHAKVSSTSALPLLAVPFSVLPMMMLTTPMVILFVYDKTNGVLEYLISLGMTQRSIYMRYLKAALLIAIVYLLVFGILNIIYSYIQFGTTYLSVLLLVLGIGAAIGISTVAFIITMMMIFSSLQKARAGGNQPLAITLGFVGLLPGYVIPFLFSYNTALIVECIQAVIIGGVALSLILLSGKLIKREKFLP